ncbi:hypothetical protein CTA2_10038 [Colletotrichum tanaceti]|nr:hypothetical protein CTA2_10038 [Colletotrichum tanaceti]
MADGGKQAASPPPLTRTAIYHPHRPNQGGGLGARPSQDRRHRGLGRRRRRLQPAEGPRHRRGRRRHRQRRRRLPHQPDHRHRARDGSATLRRQRRRARHPRQCGGGALESQRQGGRPRLHGRLVVPGEHRGPGGDLRGLFRQLRPVRRHQVGPELVRPQAAPRGAVAHQLRLPPRRRPHGHE